MREKGANRLVPGLDYMVDYLVLIPGLSESYKPSNTNFLLLSPDFIPIGGIRTTCIFFHSLLFMLCNKIWLCVLQPATRLTSTLLGKSQLKPSNANHACCGFCCTETRTRSKLSVDLAEAGRPRAVIATVVPVLSNILIHFRNGAWNFI